MPLVRPSVKTACQGACRPVAGLALRRPDCRRGARPSVAWERGGMEPIELWYEGAGGMRLYCRSWPPPAPRAGLIALHGLGDHSGLYPMIGETLAGRGIAVLTPDLRGNGRSPG